MELRPRKVSCCKTGDSAHDPLGLVFRVPLLGFAYRFRLKGQFFVEAFC